MARQWISRSGLFLVAALAAGPRPAEAQQAPTAPTTAPASERADVARFAARATAILSAAGADKGYWGVVVADAATGQVLYALNADHYFIPASNAKLFTTALALATLGPDYRFRTTIETRGTLERSGRLRGDLVLVGRGDPNLSNRKFPYEKKVERDGPPEKVLAELADGVAARGVKEIEGDIVADDSYFDDEPYPDGWAIDDMVWGYGAAVSAISVNDNMIFLELRPGEREGDPAWFSVEPWADGWTIRNALRTGAAGSESKPQISREPGSRTIALGGTIPLDAKPIKEELGVEKPAEHAAALLLRLLEGRGVRVYGQARARHFADTAAEAPPPGSATVLAEHVSVPLDQAVRLLNKISQNLHAELLLRDAAREKAGAVTLDDALKFAEAFRQGIGIAEGDVVLSDGSGLSRTDLVTPRAVVQLLEYAATQPWGEALRSSLPVAGEDGTLSDRMKNTAAAGRIQAKTGSIEHVDSLSGYATSRHGARLVFSMFGNNHNLKGKDSTGVLDALAVAMVEELGAAKAEAPAQP